MPSPVTVTRGAVALLLSALSQPGWTKAAASIYRAGKLIDELETKFADVPASENTPAAQREWSYADAQFDLTDKEKDVIKECFAHHLAEGHIAPSKHFRVLADAVGLAVGDDD